MVVATATATATAAAAPTDTVASAAAASTTTTATTATTTTATTTAAATWSYDEEDHLMNEKCHYKGIFTRKKHSAHVSVLWISYALNNSISSKNKKCIAFITTWWISSVLIWRWSLRQIGFCPATIDGLLLLQTVTCVVIPVNEVSLSASLSCVEHEQVST